MKKEETFELPHKDVVTKTIVRYDKESLDRLTEELQKTQNDVRRILSFSEAIDEIRATLASLSDTLQFLEWRIQQLHEPFAEEMRQYLAEHGMDLIDKITEEKK